MSYRKVSEASNVQGILDSTKMADLGDLGSSGNVVKPSGNNKHRAWSKENGRVVSVL